MKFRKYSPLRLTGALLWLGAVAVLGCFILFSTNPDELGPVGVTASLAVGYVFILLSFQSFVLGLRRVLARPSDTLKGWRLVYGAILAVLPLGLIALQSLGQLVARDVLLFTLFGALTVFYVSKRTPQK